jgi:hypothetical protein
MSPEDMAKIAHLAAGPGRSCSSGPASAHRSGSLGLDITLKQAGAFARLPAAHRAYAGDLEDVKDVMSLLKRKRVIVQEVIK